MTDSVHPQGDFAPASSSVAIAANGFTTLGLAPELLQAVSDLGYTQPTQVQEKVIPMAMSAEDAGFVDLMVSSQTGSGKTAAFLLPVLHTLLQQQEAQAARERAEYQAAAAEASARGEALPKRAKRKNPLNARHFKAAVPGALVLCPTRELAQQVAHDAIGLVKHCKGLRIATVVGGMPYQMQIAKLQNADLVVATPGRLLDLQRSMQIKLNEVQFLVVDEADRMLDLGFADDLAEIHQLTAQRKQTMMFSATFAPRIQQLALRVMHEGGANVQRVQVDSPQEKHANIQQSLYWADNADHKRKLLDHWLRDTSIGQAIVFASTQIECDGLAGDLQQSGFSAVALHGALSQGLRNRRLMALRNGQVQILVATDVAARGIDVPSITHVFNFGLPMKAEDYTHRIGRTGRAGRDGLAVTFAEFRDRRKIFDIEGYTRQPLKAEVIEGLEPTQRPPQARREGPGAGARGGRRDFGRDDRRDGGRDGGRGRFERAGGPGRSGFGGSQGFADRAPREGFGAPRERAPYGGERPSYGERATAYGAPPREGYGERSSHGPRRDADGYAGKSGFGAAQPRGAARFDGGGARFDGAARRPEGSRPQGDGRPQGRGRPYAPHDGQQRARSPR